MSYDPELGDIVEIEGFGALLWEVIGGRYIAAYTGIACAKVTYWGCPPNTILSMVALNKLKAVKPNGEYRVEITRILRPQNEMVVLAISARDPVEKGRLPWLSLPS